VVKKSKDWTGNKTSIFTTLSASSHSEFERQEDDYYATEPKAMELLLEQEDFENVWECACGEGHLAEVLKEKGILSKATDLIDRGYGTSNYDFLNNFSDWGNGDIITNPPYKYAQEFVEQSLRLIDDGRKVAMFLKIQFMEGQKRREMFKKYPPKIIYVSSSRLNCARNGEFDKFKSSAVAYCWYVWEKGFTGDPIIKWIN